MTSDGWIQLLIFCIALVAITKPMGIYLLRVLDPDKEGGLGMVTMLLSYGLYRIQDLMPLQQNMHSLGASTDAKDVINGGGKVPGIIAFLPAARFVTNTDWQSY